jgi:hypothetical protein
LTDTSNRVELRRATSLRLNDIREDLKYCHCRIKLVILDCCFSGIATKNTQGADDLADRIERASRVTGSFTLTASRAHQSAIYDDAAGGLTYFTKVLTEIVRDGITGKPEELTLADIHQELEHRFEQLQIPAQLERPEPTRLFYDTADRFIFARNAAPPQARRASSVETPLHPRDTPDARPTRSRSSEELAGRLDHLRRRSWILTGGALAVGTVMGSEYATHHHAADQGESDHPNAADGHPVDDGADSAWSTLSASDHKASPDWGENDAGDAPGLHGSGIGDGMHGDDAQMNHYTSATDFGSFDGGN